MNPKCYDSMTTTYIFPCRNKTVLGRFRAMCPPYDIFIFSLIFNAKMKTLFIWALNISAFWYHYLTSYSHQVIFQSGMKHKMFMDKYVFMGCISRNDPFVVFWSLLFSELPIYLVSYNFHGLSQSYLDLHQNAD